MQLREDHPLLTHIHCVAHRLALAVSQSANEVQQIKKYQQDVNTIFKHYQYSAIRYNRLRLLQEAVEDTPVALKQPNAVCWLSLLNAVDAIDKSWAALVAVLGEEAANQDPVAIGLSKRVECYQFVAYTCIMLDILPVFTKLSKAYQTDALEYDKFSMMLKTTKDSLVAMNNPDNAGMLHFQHLQNSAVDADGKLEYRGVSLKRSETVRNSATRVKALFIGELLAQVDRRFPKDGITLMDQLNTLFNPRRMNNLPPQDLAAYGVNELESVLKFFAKEEIIDSDRALQDFLQFKQFVRRQEGVSQKALLHDLITSYQDVFPDFVVFGNYFLSIPLNSAACERGFSAQNRTKTRYRNRLGEARMSEILRITINSSSGFEDLDYTKAATAFNAMKERRK